MRAADFEETAKPRRYFLLLLILVVALMPLFALFEAVRRVAPCDGSHYSEGNFLGYCWDRQYADYEKGAYFLPTEPLAVENARRADVLFLGNSRMEYAFSNSVVEDFAKSEGRSIYTLGFAGEGAEFSLRLMDRQRLRPKIIVVNLDGVEFFGANPLPDAVKLFDRPAPGWVEYYLKRLGQAVQRRICAAGGQTVGMRLMPCGSEDTVYRRVSDGFWLFSHRPHIADTYPIVVGTKTVARLRYDTLHAARAFVKKMRESGICVVFVDVPSEEFSPGLGREQARAAGVQLVEPALDGLKTFDHSHLGPESARRYAAAVLNEVRPKFKTCKGGVSGS